MGFGTAIQIGVIGAALLGVGLLIWMAFRSARKRGQAEVRHDYAANSAERAQEAARIDDEVAGLDSDDLDSELRG